MPKAKPLPDQETLKRLLDYDPDTGIFIWKKRTPDDFDCSKPITACSIWNANFAGKRAFCVKKQEYLGGAILGVNRLAHRIAFKMQTGLEPEEVDHLNGDTKDNRFANLRAADRSLNQRNRAVSRNSKTGVNGVIRRADGAFAAQIYIKGRTKKLGVFDTLEEAKEARRKADEKFAFHPNHGRPTRKI